MMLTREEFRRLRPMLAIPSPPFNSEDFIFEVKWDGFRCLAYFGDATELRSRNGRDMTAEFPELAGLHRLARQLPVVADGEIIVMGGDVPSFYELQKRSRSSGTAVLNSLARCRPATYVVFDVLYAGGQKLINLPLVRRKEILLTAFDRDERLVISEGIPRDGIALFGACVGKGLEGVVAKKADSVYVPGKRSPYWKKFKKVSVGDFVICGFKQTQRESRRVDSLLLGVRSGDGFVFQGMVGVGLGGQTGEELYGMLINTVTENPLFRVPREVARGLNWVAPRLCCSVEFLEPAGDGGLRHPVFRGLRHDMDPEDCTGIAGALGGSGHGYRSEK